MLAHQYLLERSDMFFPPACFQAKALGKETTQAVKWQILLFLKPLATGQKDVQCRVPVVSAQ